MSRSEAWGCMVTNLLFWPGLGSVLARRKIGFVQMGLSGGGAFLIIVAMGWFFWKWMDTQQTPALMGTYTFLAIAGLVLFGGAWIWSLFTGLDIVRSIPPVIEDGSSK